MKLKESSMSDLVHGRFPHKKKWLAILAVFVFGLLCFSAGVVVHKTGAFGNFIKPLIRSNLVAVAHYVQGFTVAPESVKIDIKFKDYQVLAHQRAEALKNGILMVSSEDTVPAEIKHNGRALEAKIRLKGDLVDQLKTDRWPFRVVMKGDHTLLGMKRFSLHTPQTRGYATEWLLHKMMQREGVIALRYEFVDVTLNGKHLGIYALEEHFEKKLIENNRRPEGPILSFSEEFDITSLAHFGVAANKRGDFYGEKVDVYNPTQTFESPKLKEEFFTAKNKLELYRRGQATTCATFDCAVLARYMAIADLFNAGHAVKYGDFKLYYNPVTARLEPIVFDAESGDDADAALANKGLFAETRFKNPMEVWPLFFNDPQFFELYLAELGRISAKDFLDSFYAAIKEELGQKLKIIYRSDPWYALNREYLYANQAYIRKVFDQPLMVNAYAEKIMTKDGKKILTLKAGNIQPFPLKALSVTLEGQGTFPIAGDAQLLKERSPNSPAVTQTLGFALPADFQWRDDYYQKLKINYTLPGTNIMRSEKVTWWKELDEDFTKRNFMLQPSNIEKFDSVSIDKEKKRIFFKPGDWTISRPMIVPEGYTLTVREGTRINLTNRALILSFSPVDMRGSTQAPIIIESSDRTGEGLAIVTHHEPSFLAHVIFRKLTSPKKEGWALTGALTFYQSDVTLSHCQIIENKSEDALNIIRSEFLIEDTLIKQTSSDALDADWSRGTIRDTQFLNCQKDCVEISSGTVDVQDVLIDTSGDRGLNVGENSRMTAKNVTLKNVQIGIAARDIAEFQGDNIKIQGARIGFITFRRNTQPAGARLHVSGYAGEGVDTLHKIEEGSQLTLDSEVIQGKEQDVYSELYGQDGSVLVGTL